MTDVGEGAGKPHVCATDGPPHTWVVTEPGTGPEEHQEAKKEEAEGWRDKDQKRVEKGIAMKNPNTKLKYTEEARSADFEATAIKTNHEKKPIKSCEVKYECSVCKENTKVDIVFEDGQLAETQSETSENYRKESRKAAQAAKYVDIQRQINEENGTNHRPMAKFDKAQAGDAAKMEEIAVGRGLVPEAL